MRLLGSFLLWEVFGTEEWQNHIFKLLNLFHFEPIRVVSCCFVSGRPSAFIWYFSFVLGVLLCSSHPGPQGGSRTFWFWLTQAVAGQTHGTPLKRTLVSLGVRSLSKPLAEEAEDWGRDIWVSEPRRSAFFVPFSLADYLVNYKLYLSQLEYARHKGHCSILELET